MFEILMAPVVLDEDLLGVSVIYQDVTDAAALQSEITRSQHELEQAYDELQSTVEELETTNEELQSTNEELETTNEELESTNEELETTNEELQSSNEELQTTNDELRHRTLEVGEMNAFLETILSTVGLAVAVIDGEGCVQVWNGQARELWGLDADDVAEQPLLGLDIGLPVEQLRGAIRGCLNGETPRQELTLQAVNRRGRTFDCRVICLAVGTGQSGGEISGVILTSSRRSPVPGTLTRATAFVEERAGLGITIDDIAAAAGVSPRALQLTFRRHLGLTPTAYMRQLRIARAHRELEQAEPDSSSTVSRIALDWGFASASRFAAYYRSTYGHPPNETLRS